MQRYSNLDQMKKVVNGKVENKKLVLVKSETRDNVSHRVSSSNC